MQRFAIYILSPAESLHQVVFVLELEEGRNFDICADSACDRSDRSLQPSDRLLGQFNVLSVGPV